MVIRIMTLKFNPVLEQFDDAALQDYLKDKETLSVKDHFFIKNDIPYITLIIQCHENPDDASGQAKPGKSDESWKEILKPHEFPLFNTLRNWRAECAKKDGISPYIICTNRQLAEMVSRRPRALRPWQKSRALIIGQANQEAPAFGSPEGVRTAGAFFHMWLVSQTSYGPFWHNCANEFASTGLWIGELQVHLQGHN